MTKPAALKFPILLLNSTERERVEVAVVLEKKAVTLERNERAQSLPQLIPLVLEKANLSMKEINCLAVCNRPGSLTGTRLGVTITNTLGWLNNKPIIELSADSLKAAIVELRTNKIVTHQIATVQNEVVY